MSFGWSREIVYWYYHSYILDHHHLHLLLKVQTKGFVVVLS